MQKQNKGTLVQQNIERVYRYLHTYEAVEPGSL